MTEEEKRFVAVREESVAVCKRPTTTALEKVLCMKKYIETRDGLFALGPPSAEIVEYLVAQGVRREVFNREPQAACGHDARIN